MGTYSFSIDALIEPLDHFLQDVEGDVSAEALAGAFNKIAQREGWNERLQPLKLCAECGNLKPVWDFMEGE